ncbi:MAG TPA: hypothetical protein VK698_13880 [Kofleriaceae bacterium]|nr:hypothetical protein [Kofleriaceae bacterium]
MSGPEQDSWQEALTRRLRTLIRTAPLHRVEASKGMRDVDLSEQDLRALALRALDLTIEQMGLGSGAAVAELCEGLRPLVLQCQPSLTAAEADEIALVVVEALLNERERRQAFREPYLAVDAEGATRRHIPFHLLREHSLADGTIVLKATTEAINLYAGMLEYPVEDAQIADEAVLRAQVARGRIADAVRTAQRARLRSIEYEQKLVGILETTRRDVQQIDWVREVLGLLDQARDHLEDRLNGERELIGAVERRLEAATGGAAELVSLKDTLDECYQRHLRLHRRIIPANQQYLDEQDRQAFRPRALAPLPDLEADVLRPALVAPAGALAGVAERLFGRLVPPRPPAVVHLPALIARLLARRRDEEPEEIEPVSIELEELPVPASRFSPADQAAAQAILGRLGGQSIALGQLLARARGDGAAPSTLALVVLEVLLAFDGRARTGRASLAVERGDLPLDDPGFGGDELVVARAG